MAEFADIRAVTQPCAGLGLRAAKARLAKKDLIISFCWISVRVSVEKITTTGTAKTSAGSNMAREVTTTWWMNSTDSNRTNGVYFVLVSGLR